MKLVKCGKCGAQFDVSTFKPGSAFACGKCRAAVQVPGDAPTASAPPEPAAAAPKAAPATAASKAAPKLPPAMQARAAQQSGGARAVGAAPAPSPATATAAPAAPAVAAKPSRASRTRDDGSEPKKPPVALWAGIGVVVVGAGAFFAFSGSKSADSSRPVEEVKPKDPSNPIDFVQMSVIEQNAALTKRLAEAGDLLALEKLYTWLNDGRLAGNAEVKATKAKVVETALAKDANCGWARAASLDLYLALSVTEQHDQLMQRYLAVENDLGGLQKLSQWLLDPKVKNTAEAKVTIAKVYDAALKKDKDCGWAREMHGDRRIRDALEAAKKECAEAFQYPDPPEKEIQARLDDIENRPWADPIEWDRFQGLIAKSRTRTEKIKSDPRYKIAETKRNWVRLNPMFKEVELTWYFADPYVIFQEVKKLPHTNNTKRVVHEDTGFITEDPIPGTVDPAKVRMNEDWAKKGDLFAKRDATIFTELNRRFRELWAERFKLPTLQERSRMMTGLVMWNRTSFDKLLREAGMPVSPGVRAFYSPPQQKIFHYIGDESLTNEDEIPCEGGRVQKQSDQVTFHEGTHQLQHEYSAIFRGSPLKDEDTKVDERKAMWFEEGMAEFMGAVEVEEGKTEYLDDVKWFHNRILLDRISESRDNREFVEKWKIKEFMKPNDNGALFQLGDKLAPGRGGNMASHFYCRSWAFCHFLWYYDNGKYREKFNQYLGEVLKGTQSSDKFAKIMGRPSVNDWGDVEMEYEWYWHELLLRKVGATRITRKQSRPSSEAPTGKVEDDPDFIEMWKEAHKGDKGGKK